MKEQVVKTIHKSLKELDVKIPEEKIESLIEIPPSVEMGDFAFPCFSLAKEMKIPPKDIALEVRGKIQDHKFQDIRTSGAYINFFVNRNFLVKEVLKEINSKKDKFGKPDSKETKTMVEFPSPNTNKPLHLGHLRNMTIGESVSRILEFNNEKVIRSNLNNDRGIHICKSMAAYKFYGKNKTPTSEKQKPDHFVGDFYVKFNQYSKKNEKLEIESHRMLQRYEQKDKETLKLWKKMNHWALKGFEETYKKFGIKHNVEFFESKLYEKGKEIVQQGLKDKIFKKGKKGEILIDLKKEKLREKVLLRSDGTSVYITQDLHLAKLKFDKYKINKSIYVVGNEQKYHFDVLFTILKKLGFKEEMHHLSYGMIELPEGKMKSREGKVVDADEIITNVQELVKKELNKREKLSKTKLEKRSSIIALSAIKYLLVKSDIRKNMVFNPKESINFEGNTGPYILYSYARAFSILKKSKNKRHATYNRFNKKEFELIKKLNSFKTLVQKSYSDLNPSLIAQYSYDLAKLFNEFYHNSKVIDSREEPFRIQLVESFRIVLKNSLNLLGIEVLEEM